MIVDCALYEQGSRRDGALDLEAAAQAARQDNAFVWIGLYEPTEGEFDAVRREFELPELAVEDAIHAHQRPKLERYGEMLFLVLKPARYVDAEELVDLGEIALFVGRDYVVSVRHGPVRELHDVRVRLEAEPDILRCGPTAVLYAVLDQVVDDYGPVIDGLENDIEEVEREVFSHERRHNAAQRIYVLRRETIEFHRATAPLADPVGRLAAGEYKMVPEQLVNYLRDVHDHLLRVDGRVDAARDVLATVLTANLTQVGVRQNEDIRRISAWVAIIAVPTMIAGIYGMNFEHMPELEWTYGYPAALAAMAFICTFLYRYFKRSGWL